MKNVTYISAGAGSGKTYTLTHKLADLIKDKVVDPEKVILTTFTTKAAGEFREKAKAILFEEGLHDAASRLDQAMIGTVHSIANSFIRKYWYFLGLSPEMNVLAEEDVDFYVSQSISELPTDDELKALKKFREEFEMSRYDSASGTVIPMVDYWKEELKAIIGFSTNHEISDYSESRRQSIEYLRGLVRPGADVNTDPAYLKTTIEALLDCVNGMRESASKSRRLQTLNLLKKKVNDFSIKDTKDLAKVGSATNATMEVASDFVSQVEHLWHSELVFKEQEAHINLIFDLAQRWKNNYADFKRQKGLLDYNDMEKYMYQLLQMPEVAPEIAGSFEYLFVDEFQDCSPIQVKIFDCLSGMMKHSWWVGDFKQAIFGFRGSDTELTKAVVDRIAAGKDGCDKTTLKDSHRSLPDLVNAANKAFAKTFDGVLDAESVKLNPVRENKNNVQSLRYVRVAGEKPADIAGELAPDIIKLLQEGIAPTDIAVLAWSNYELATLAESLEAQYNVHTTRGNTAVTDSKVTALVQSLLSLVVNPNDSQAKAIVALYTEPGFDTPDIIDAKLQYDADESEDKAPFLNEVRLVHKLLALRNGLKRQSIAALVESMIIELDLFNLVRMWAPAKDSINVLHTINTVARQYEEHCIQMNLPATVNGYLDYLNLVNPVCPGDEDGIQLSTYHKSKGLEWKYVFMLSLADDPVETGKIVRRSVFGVNAIYTTAPSADNPYPELYIKVMPWIYGGGRAKVPEDIELKIESSELFANARKRTLAESNRLLYVGFTRASDAVILVAGDNENPMLWFNKVGLPSAGVFNPSGGWWDCLGIGVKFKNYTITAEETDTVGGYMELDNPNDSKSVRFSKDPSAAPLRDLSPSGCFVPGGKVELLKEFGKRIALGRQAGKTAQDVGNCIHQIFCGIENNGSDDYISRLVQSYGLEKMLPEAGGIKNAWTSLVSFLEENYGPSIQRHHELAFKHLDNGQIFTGSMDFVWKTAEGCVLVDFKTCPKGKTAILDENDAHYAGKYKGQFDCYEAALKAAGEKVLAKIIYYPVSGLLVAMVDEDDCADAQTERNT